ncbi:hypothetical protein HDZ31DRAFT_62046 [Schizophyllum fasciatum]
MPADRTDNTKIYTLDNLPGFVNKVCEACGIYVSSPRDQRRHARGHLSEKIPGNLAIKKPHACDQCHMRFALKHSLTVHLDSLHYLRKPHACPEEDCDAAYSDPAALARHRKKIHNWVSPKARGPRRKRCPIPAPKEEAPAQQAPPPMNVMSNEGAGCAQGGKGGEPAHRGQGGPSRAAEDVPPPAYTPMAAQATMATQTPMTQIPMSAAAQTSARNSMVARTPMAPLPPMSLFNPKPVPPFPQYVSAPPASANGSASTSTLNTPPAANAYSSAADSSYASAFDASYSSACGAPYTNACGASYSRGLDGTYSRGFDASYAKHAARFPGPYPQFSRAQQGTQIPQGHQATHLPQENQLLQFPGPLHVPQQQQAPFFPGPLHVPQYAAGPSQFPGPLHVPGVAAQSQTQAYASYEGNEYPDIEQQLAQLSQGVQVSYY